MTYPISGKRVSNLAPWATSDPASNILEVAARGLVVGVGVVVDGAQPRGVDDLEVYIEGADFEVVVVTHLDGVGPELLARLEHGDEILAGPEID